MFLKPPVDLESDENAAATASADRRMGKKRNDPAFYRTAFQYVGSIIMETTLQDKPLLSWYNQSVKDENESG